MSEVEQIYRVCYELKEGWYGYTKEKCNHEMCNMDSVVKVASQNTKYLPFRKGLLPAVFKRENGRGYGRSRIGRIYIRRLVEMRPIRRYISRYK
jgi:hypothetical protein